MRKFLVALTIAAITASFSVAAPPAQAPGRTIKNLPNFPLESLRKGLSRPLYRSLSVSPISVWLVARARLVKGRTTGAKIIHQEGNGAYDEMILEAANSYGVTGQNVTETRIQADTLDVHLLIYEIKDGKMAVCFAHSGDARYVGYEQGGIAWVGISQSGGPWNTISGKPVTKWGGRR
jgi:hypothetical protein